MGSELWLQHEVLAEFDVLEEQTRVTKEACRQLRGQSDVADVFQGATLREITLVVLWIVASHDLEQDLA